MKASHLTTPRTQAECQFIPSADPIERPATRRVSGFAVMLIAAALVMATGGLAACIAR